MRFPQSVLRAAGVLAVVSLACSLPSIAPPAILPSTVAHDSTSAEAPTATASAPGATPTQAPLSFAKAPPPAGIEDAIKAKVDAGEWSFEDGLINGLKLFTGEAQPAALLAEEPVFLEGFGLVKEAQRYVREGADPAVRQQLAERLDRMLPTRDRLLEYTKPAPTAWRAPGLAAMSSDEGECATLFGNYSKDGFPKPDPPGSGVKCLLYKEGGIGGQTIGVYLPIGYVTQLGYADAAYTAIVDSWQKYSKLTPSGAPPQTKGVDLLFMLLPNVESPKVLAAVPSQSTDDRCLIMVYLGAIKANEQKKTAGGGYGYFKQTIAHEMFHCFQEWNFSSQADDNWKVQDWWGEGTATYFGNVVYPSVNKEWEFLPALAWRSAENSVVDMSYENFLFFQFFANKRGNQAILDLIQKLPTGVGVDEHAKALAKVADIQALFHDFGRGYLDGTIQDSSGEDLPTVPPYIPPENAITVDALTTRTLEAKPFVLSRYSITFPLGWRYTNSSVVVGSAFGYDSARLAQGKPSWGDLPPKVAAGCAPVMYYILLTTADGPPATLARKIDLNPAESQACDKCLIGTWDLNKQSFQEYAEAPFAATPGLYHFLGAEGLFRYRLRQDGTMTAEFDFIYLYYLTQENSPLGNNIRVDGRFDIDGMAEGTYASDGVSSLAMNIDQNMISINQQIWMNGQQMDNSPFGQGAPQGLTGSNAVYSCDGDKLLLNFAPESSLPPLQFDRSSGTP